MHGLMHNSGWKGPQEVLSNLVLTALGHPRLLRAGKPLRMEVAPHPWAAPSTGTLSSWRKSHPLSLALTPAMLTANTASNHYRHY